MDIVFNVWNILSTAQVKYPVVQDALQVKPSFVEATALVE
jgi:hypothetical protein